MEEMIIIKAEKSLQRMESSYLMQVEMEIKQ
ncbi:hypothetical protein B0I65_002291 [Clostridium beijerinckii]|nr:hypothetical protein [Clostridium beijerinckii]NRV90740.1 hypothetical protein [Clostridium beijerinckii]NRW28713.1 hypothetical protein [Clostridium beijerinckii]NRW92911.1 hypothetical protein [Clostridium beijerinckii]